MAEKEESKDNNPAGGVAPTIDSLSEDMNSGDFNSTPIENVGSETQPIAEGTMVTSTTPENLHSQAAHSLEQYSLLDQHMIKSDLAVKVEDAVCSDGETKQIEVSSTRSTARSAANNRSSSVDSKRTDSSGKPSTSRSDSLSRKEREEKVRETRERMEKEKDRKLQDLLDVQKTAEELRLKQQEIRKKRLEDLKSKDGERQRAAEERRKKREQDEEERKRNFLRKRLDRANKADGDTRLKKGKHESYGFGSSAPRFEDIILTSSPGTRSMSQLNLSAMRKSTTSGDEAEQDSPRPGSATPGDGASPRNNTSDSCAMYITRPLSKSTINISSSARRALDTTPRHRRVSASTSLSNSENVDHSLQQVQRRKPRISFSPVTPISSHGGSAARAKSSEPKSAAPFGDRLSRSSTRLTTAGKPGAKGGGGPVTRAKSTGLPDNLKQSVARLSAARTPQTDLSDKSKPKASISASHSNLSSISKSRPPRSPPIELIKSHRPDRLAPTTNMGTRSMTTGDINKLGLSRAKRSSDAAKKPTSNPTERKASQSKPKPSLDSLNKSVSSDNDTGAAKSSLKARSSSATRTSSLTKSVEETNHDTRSKTLDRPSKAQRAAKAEAMSKSMYASANFSASAASSTGSTGSTGRMRKARSVGNISRAQLTTKKEGETLRPAMTRTPLSKSKSTDPVKPTVTKKTSTPPSKPASKPAATPNKMVAAASSKTATPTSSKPSSKTATPGGSRRSSKDSNAAVSPKGTRSATPTPELAAKVEDVNCSTPNVPDTVATATTVESGPTIDAEAPKESSVASSSPVPKEESKKSVKAAEMEEYKAKLAEKRREAREKAEKEAEEERQRQVQTRLEEEQREHEEEERQRQFELEQNRLMADARQQEQERLEKAIEEEEKRRREESERLESDRLAKEEAAEKARQDAEKKEKEKQERIAKEELEKQERKKKLEMIMKRVKTGSPTPDKAQPSSEPPSMSSSMTGSMTSSTPSAAGSTGTFKSPLLQGLMAKSTSETTPERKFSSPLLNNLMAKVNADRNEDNSSNSSSSNTPTSQPNSSQTSPEHKIIEPHTATENDSQMSVQTEGGNSPFSIYLGEDDSRVEHVTANTNHSGQLLDSGSAQGHVNSNINNINGNASPKVIVENGASISTQNGAAHTVRLNGNEKSAGTDEQQSAFEEVLNLSNKQSEATSANPAPIIAFDDSSAHTEGGDAQHAANTPLYLIPNQDQKCTSVEETKPSLPEKSWKQLDDLMCRHHEETIDSLAHLGISEGDPDDESDEGQIWQMVEGRLPYTLDMV